MLMPEATIHQNGHAKFKDEQIRRSGQIPTMQAIPQSRRPKRTPHKHFRSRVLAVTACIICFLFFRRRMVKKSASIKQRNALHLKIEILIRFPAKFYIDDENLQGRSPASEGRRVGLCSPRVLGSSSLFESRHIRATIPNAKSAWRVFLEHRQKFHSSASQSLHPAEYRLFCGKILSSLSNRHK